MTRGLSRDLDEIKNSFPKLTYQRNKKIRFLKGDLDICDAKGNYWDTFNIAIIIPENYPYGIPILIELSKKIPRDEDRHINEKGICCVDIDHELIYLAKQGIGLEQFIRTKVYPYFANQLYFNEKGEYSNGAYKHHFKGVEQFYNEKLKIPTSSNLIVLLEDLIKNKIPGRNERCFCGSDKKRKDCHNESIKFLKTLDKERLKKDLMEFKKVLNNNS